MGWQTESVVQLLAGDTIINPNGEFVYSAAPAAGDLIVSITPASGTDSFGNAYQQGVTIYASGTNYAQLLNAILSFIQSGMNGPATVELLGAAELGITSGTQSVADSPAQVILQSAASQGVSSLVTLSAAHTTLNTTATSSVPSSNVNPGHQSNAPGAYSQAYEQATTNRVNQIMDVLSQTGIWPF